MKIKFSVDVDVNPQTMRDSDLDKVQRRDVRHISGRVLVCPYFPAGTIYESPAAPMWVMNGMGEPADDECREACGHLTPNEIAVKQHAFLRQERGIPVDEWKLYDAGYLIGHNDEKPRVDALGNKSNTWVPGPKFEEYLGLLAQAEEDDDDE